jgi:hypothetical protein
LVHLQQVIAKSGAIIVFFADPSRAANANASVTNGVNAWRAGARPGRAKGCPDGLRKAWERFRRVQETDTDRYVFSG